MSEPLPLSKSWEIADYEFDTLGFGDALEAGDVEKAKTFLTTAVDPSQAHVYPRAKDLVESGEWDLAPVCLYCLTPSGVLNLSRAPVGASIGIEPPKFCVKATSAGTWCETVAHAAAEPLNVVPGWYVLTGTSSGAPVRSGIRSYPHLPLGALANPLLPLCWELVRPGVVLFDP